MNTRKLLYGSRKNILVLLVLLFLGMTPATASFNTYSIQKQDMKNEKGVPAVSISSLVYDNIKYKRDGTVMEIVPGNSTTVILRVVTNMDRSIENITLLQNDRVHSIPTGMFNHSYPVHITSAVTKLAIIYTSTSGELAFDSVTLIFGTFTQRIKSIGLDELSDNHQDPTSTISNQLVFDFTGLHFGPRVYYTSTRRSYYLLLLQVENFVVNLSQKYQVQITNMDRSKTTGTTSELKIQTLFVLAITGVMICQRYSQRFKELK